MITVPKTIPPWIPELRAIKTWYGSETIRKVDATSIKHKDKYKSKLELPIRINRKNGTRHTQANRGRFQRIPVNPSKITPRSRRKNVSLFRLVRTKDTPPYTV